MASKVSICNMALSRLGAATITSLTDGTQESKLCNTFFDLVADRVMMQGTWSSTVKRATLARTTNTPTFGFTFEYQLPVDPKSLKVLNVSEETDGSIDYVVEGDKILTDESTLKIRYIAQLTDTEDWDPMLTEAVELLLAAYLALPITGQAPIAEKMKQEYFSFLNNNLAIDGQQGSSQEYISVDLTGVRF